jgi:hypothetical protein
VILVHAVFHRDSLRPGGLRGLHRKLYYHLLCNLERRIYKNPRIVLAAVSRHTAGQLKYYFGRNDVTLIPNGVDPAHFSPDAAAAMRQKGRHELQCSPEDFVVLLVGNDWRNKGLKKRLRSDKTSRFDYSSWARTSKAHSVQLPIIWEFPIASSFSRRCRTSEYFIPPPTFSPRLRLRILSICRCWKRCLAGSP